jgi:hypothetical protein
MWFSRTSGNPFLALIWSHFRRVYFSLRSGFSIKVGFNLLYILSFSVAGWFLEVGFARFFLCPHIGRCGSLY